MVFKFQAARWSAAAFAVVLGSGVGAVLGGGSPVAAQVADVDLELMLLADATGSIDDDEIRFQRQGYATALADPQVLDAITGGLQGRIAIAYAEWGASRSQHLVVDWTIVEDAASAEAFGAALLSGPRRAFGRNAIGSALLFGLDQIETNAHTGLRRVIDLSADSANNWNGPTIEEARASVAAAGVTINGLAVLCRGCASGRPVSYDLEARFERDIISGPDAFVITADSAETFADAVKRKLVLEISGLPAPRRVRLAGAAPKTAPARE